MSSVLPFAPLISQGLGALGGWLGGKAATNAAMQRSPEEQAALTGGQTQAGNLGQTGSTLMGQGTGNMGQAGSYYSTLLSGNRAAMANATAGQRAGVQDATRGMQANLAASGIRGAAKDQLAGNIMRQQGGQLAGLTTGVQPWAANQLGSLGSQQAQIGTSASNASGNIYGNLLNLAQKNKFNAQQVGQNVAGGIMGLATNTGNQLGKMYPPGPKPLASTNYGSPAGVMLPKDSSGFSLADAAAG